LSVADRFHSPAFAEQACHVVAHVRIVVGEDDALPGVRRVGRTRGEGARNGIGGLSPPARLVDECLRADGGRRKRSAASDASLRKVRRAARNAHFEPRSLTELARDANVAAV